MRCDSVYYMIYYILLAALIMYSIIVGNMFLTMVGTALMVLPFAYSAGKGMFSEEHKVRQIVVIGALFALAMIGIPMHAFPVTITAVLVIICYALGYVSPLREWIRYKSTSVPRQAARHPLIRDDWMKRKPIPSSAYDIKSLEEKGMYDMPKGTTHGVPGYGIGNVDKFGKRAEAGAAGERVLGGMLVESGILNIPGVHSFWSLHTPDDHVDIDIDCAIMYGNRLWLLDAKRYTPSSGDSYLVRDIRGSEYSYDDRRGYEYHPSLRMITLHDDDVESIHRNGGSWNKGSYDAAIAYADAIMEKGKGYEQTKSGYISVEAITKVLYGGVEIHSYVVLTPTVKGTPGVGVDTNYSGDIHLDQAKYVLCAIRKAIEQMPRQPLNTSNVDILDRLVKENENA